ncbi:ABC transporter ATP-binding protein [archaeon]|jgi:ABC-2 type transport system ATP-binding protein|nr:ABC transporter ATP-binding protein [Candidatus Woesearchaeota archaeon]MBT3720788.1 ABC transporter ATP-binding protein [archaeon]MBT4021938.1 ABC transporter ATP-binding protein [archaeon]MBT4272255.1 ABC transporter ATP-binding protein [archaeon]MBT4460791.1 ABC transporter ATP-binding protein [archaeon]
MYIIEFKDITKAFGSKKILDNVNLKISKGDIFGIIGPSGSGKSTLMKVLMGIYKPTSGSIYFKEKEVLKDSNFLLKVTGLTTQENSFYYKLTVKENMHYYANLNSVQMNKKDLDVHINKILRSVNLYDSKDKLAQNISGGMKRRLDFAISLVHNPELLILDEPTTGLDPKLVDQFWKIIKEVSKEGKTIIVISHIFSELEKNCNKAGILYNGKIKSVTVKRGVDLRKEFDRVVK